ncbi:glycosyltransferase [Candidatus Woesearchaeota archaeon]|nr:glycosyltransferase [Candidatus Woesearchaeota archaeon]
MIPRLNDYADIAGRQVVNRIRDAAENLAGKHVVHVNATSSGGGVAEILNTLVFLMDDLALDAGWRVILGSHSFFKVTKGFHNSLQGKPSKLTNNRKKIYLEYCERNAMINHLEKHDIVVMHDPQPLGMIDFYAKRSKWIWRCHIDLSNPHKETLEFLMPFIQKYEGIVISSDKFRIKSLDKPQVIISPSIDPLSVKNKDMPRFAARKLLKKKGIDPDIPIITQISRFDPWKGTLGVLRMYEMMREKNDCQLVLMGDMAADDPQGPVMYMKISKLAEKIPGVHLITEKNDLLVNALQKESAFIFQNSLKEGFALTVSEALWKKTPVLGTNVGGIPLQVLNGKTGYIIKDLKDGADKGSKILQDSKLRRELGRQGHEHVKQNFLITRHLEDYINLFNKLYPPSCLK